VSGTTGFNYTDMSISDDVATQAQQCFNNIQQALSQANADLNDVVRVTYILPNRADFAACWPAIRAAFDNVRPAATMICAGLLDTRMKIEIEVTAKRTRAE
jgi:enamine deaminase RidA (YjgF/YER057c/UK114 family)